MGHGVAGVLGEKLPVSDDPVLGDPSYVVRSADSLGSAAPANRAMSRWVGPLRDGRGLQAANEQLQASPTSASLHTFDELVATNLHDVSGLIVRAALMREESRGSHRRLDYDQADDRWLGRILQRLDGSHELTSFQKMGVSE
jgi:aspartate oxidase